MEWRPRRRATSRVVPEPANGSRTVAGIGSAGGHEQVGRKPVVVVESTIPDGPGTCLSFRPVLIA